MMLLKPLGSTRFLLLLQVVLVVCASLVVGWVTASGFDQLASAKIQITARYEYLERIYQLKLAAERQVTGARGYMLSGLPGVLATFTEGAAEFDAAHDALEALTQEPRDRALLAEVVALNQAYRRNAERAFTHRGPREEVLKTFTINGEALKNQASDRMVRLIDAQKGEIVAQRIQLAQAEHETRLRLLGLALLVVPLALALALVLYRRAAVPLLELSQTAARLGAGRLDARVPRRRDDEFGMVAATFNTMADRLQTSVEEQQAVQTALKESEQRYRDLFENATDMIFSNTPDGRFLYANRAFCETLGYTPEEVLALNFAQIITPESLVGARDVFARMLKGEDPGVIESTYRRKTGRAIAVEGHVSIKREDGEIVMFRSIFRDVTARREVDRLKGEFLSIVSHELRTPLTSIRGSLSLLANGKLGAFPGRAQRMLEIAVKGTDQLSRLINDMLDIERLSTGQMALERQACDVGELLTAATDAMRGLAAQADVALQIDAPAGAWVWADPDRLMQVFTNLLSNALKFSPAGTAIRLAAAARPEGIEITVADEGRGIPADMLEAVFERFKQVDSTDARDKGGTGLGLAICRTIVEQHGGRIWAESALGTGTTLRLLLPSASVPEGAGADIEKTGEPT